MKSVNFEKWQGLGNDFIILSTIDFPKEKFSEWSKVLCDRRFGIGGDGLVWIGPSDKADFRMIISNSDGSAASMCGNGLRCAVAYAHTTGKVSKSEMTIETDAGIKMGKVHLEGDKITGVTINMGKPIWEPDLIPFTSDKVKDLTVEAAGQTFELTTMNTGVPHTVAFVDSLEWDWHKAGEELMTHALFPAQTNVNFIKVVSPEHILMRVWERGAGPTMACGTGACASAVAAAATGRASRKVTVSLEGGDLIIEWDNNDDIWMTGAAEKSFIGSTELCK